MTIFFPIIVAGLLVPSTSEHQFHLVIHADNDVLTASDGMCIESFISLLQMELIKQAAIRQKLFMRNNNLVHDLLLGRIKTPERTDAALSDLGIDRRPLYQALLIHVTLGHEAQEGDFERVLAAICDTVRRKWRRIAFVESNDRITFIYNFSGESQRLRPSDIQAVLREVRGEPQLPTFTHLAALSSTSDRYSLPKINREVTDIYRLFDSSKYQNRCLHTEGLGIYKLFLGIEDLTELERLVDPRIMELRRANPTLLETLMVLCDNGLNYQRTADQLFCHIKTVRYRVNKAREVSGLDVRDSDDFLQISLASKIISIIHDRPGLTRNGTEGEV